MSLASDFATGVDLASRVKARKVRQGLAERGMTMREESHEAEMGLKDIQTSAAQERLSSLKYANSDKQRQIHEQGQQLNLDAAKQSLSNAKDQAKYNKKNQAHLDSERAYVNSQRNKQDMQERLRDGLQVIALKEKAGKAITVEDLAAFDGTVLDAKHYTDPEYLAKLQMLDSHLDPRNKAKAGNDPQVLSLLNDLFADEFNQGGGVHPETGSPVVKKTLAGVRPDMSGGKPTGRYIPSLNVHYADGSVRQDVPMTKGRDDKGQEVSSVSIADLIDQVQVRKRFGELITPMMKAVHGYGAKEKKPYDHKGKGSFNGFGQQGLNVDTFKELYQQSYMVNDPVNGSVATVGFNDVAWAGNDPERQALIQELDGMNRHIIAANANLDADEQRPLMTLAQIQQAKQTPKNDGSLDGYMASIEAKENGASDIAASGKVLTEDEQLLADAEAASSPLLTSVKAGLSDLAGWATKERNVADDEVIASGDLPAGSKAHREAKLREVNEAYAEMNQLKALLEQGKITDEQKARLKVLIAQLK